MTSADSFEKSLKQSLDQYEVPYNSADWAKLERGLDQRNGPSWYASAGLYALLLGGSLAIGSTMHLLYNEEPEMPQQGVAIAGLPENDLIEFVEVPVQQTTAPEALPKKSATILPNALEDGTAKGSKAVNQTDASGNQDKAKPQSDNSTRAAKPVAPNSNANEVLVRVSATQGCPGTTIDFGLDNASENGIYLWNFGDGSFSNQARPVHTFSKAGAYEVMLSHSAVGGGSIMNRPVSDPIVIYEAPEAAFSHLKREYSGTVPSVHFENRSVGGKSYLWDFGDGSTSTDVHTDHVYKKKGNYNVVLTVTNGKGCLDRIDRTVRIESDYDLHAPKTFSPNSDGVEDTFIPEALKTLGSKFTISIMDSGTGQVVYESNDAGKPWNGRIGNKGESCSVGDYVWMVEMAEGKNGGTYNGQVRLLR